jgi:hypothetical protein
MSLDTVLKIGKQYRQAPNYWEYHELINPVMKDVEANAKKKDKEGNIITTTFYEIPVTVLDDEVNIHMDKVKEITDEDKKKSLRYLNFKTSSKDSTKKYMFGDICYSRFFDKKKDSWEQAGNYKWDNILEEKTKERAYLGGFLRCQKLAEPIINTFIGKFRNGFSKKLDAIENLLQSSLSVVIHFDFEGKSWYQFSEYVDIIDRLIVKDITTTLEDGSLMLEKYLYKGIISSNINVPNFNVKNSFKVRSFSKDEIVYLLYALNISKQEKIRLYKTEIGIVILPSFETTISTDALNKFFPKIDCLDDELSDEDKMISEVEDTSDDEQIYSNFIYNNFDEKVKFDVIFTNIPKSKSSGVYRDLSEISNVEKSFIISLNEKIKSIKKEIIVTYNKEFSNCNDLKLDFILSYNRLIANAKSKNTDKKYQFHLLKVVPQMFNDTYYQDPILLPLFVQKSEFNIRNEIQGFNKLKYDFYFLLQLQKFKPLMAITASKSYQIGTCLGIMAKQFAAWRKDCPIKSFEKSYVGNLSRRINSLEDMTKFSNFINEKLTIHERWYSDERIAYENFVSLLRNLEDNKGEYNKNYCALGFFEYYFKSTDK